MQLRLVRESNPRLPARQAGTLATELTKLKKIWCPRRRFERAACRLQGGCSASLSYGGDVPPLRLCPRASIPSDVVSRCTRPKALGRAHPAPPTPSRAAAECMDTPEVGGADDESRTRGLDHGVVALCLLSSIRKTTGTDAGQYRRRPAAHCQRAATKRTRWCDPSIAGRRKSAKPVLVERKWPGSLRHPGLCKQSLRGALLTRYPRPDDPCPDSDQVLERSMESPDAAWRHSCPPTASQRRAQTRPDPQRVGCL